MKIQTEVKHTMVVTIKPLRSLRKEQQVVSLIFLTPQWLKENLPVLADTQAGHC